MILQQRCPTLQTGGYKSDSKWSVVPAMLKKKGACSNRVVPNGLPHTFAPSFAKKPGQRTARRSSRSLVPREVWHRVKLWVLEKMELRRKDKGNNSQYKTVMWFEPSRQTSHTK